MSYHLIFLKNPKSNRSCKFAVGRNGNYVRKTSLKIGIFSMILIAMVFCNVSHSHLFCRLVIAIKAQPTQLVLRLLRLVKLSCPFVVYHQYKEPLMELFVQLKERGGTVNLKLTETWHREIQVNILIWKYSYIYIKYIYI